MTGDGGWAFCVRHCGPDNAWEFESVVCGSGLREGSAQGEEAGDRCSAWAVDGGGGLVNPVFWRLENKITVKTVV
ncbi:hypothetical protein O3M35_001479 [Rhynocoris fuscipes]|uniref:Uncharacterized protein n=1 Tax=Rhynocoris fuscipes TaxID=488301 RepID=A0AAW1CPB3_9HEMI